MEARSLNVEPMTFPEPAMVSSSGVTVVVEAWARLAFRFRGVSFSSQEGEGGFGV